MEKGIHKGRPRIDIEIKGLREDGESVHSGVIRRSIPRPTPAGRLPRGPIKALRKEGWEVVPSTRQPRSLEKTGRRHALVVPLHPELRRGTLAGILRDADHSADELRRFVS